MAYFALLWKARTIEKYRSKYEKAKLDSIIASNAELPHTFGQKWKFYRYESQKKINIMFRRLCPEGSSASNFFVYLKTDQTFVNFVVKSVIGFVGGIMLTYFWFMFFVFQLSISLIHATIMSSIIGVALTLGLAFSYRVRCLVFLLIPQFFSRVGRYTLTCYALVLILTGPATNTMKNSEVLSESLACGQEQVKTSVTKISKSMEKPLHLIEGTMDETMKKLKYLAGKMKELMIKIHRLTMSIAHVLQSSLAWLNSVEDVCNAKLGTPYEHCLQVLGQGRLNHNLAKSLGNFDHFVRQACIDLRPEPMCVVGEYAKSSIIATVKKKLQTYSDHISSIVSVNTRVRRSHGCCNSSSVDQAAAGTVTEIRRRADPLLTWLSWSACLTSLFLLLIIFRAKYYQQMFQTRSRFDNRYVTKELRDLDFRRLKQGRETVLPLNTRERAKYVSTTSFRLLASERVHLTRSIVFMIITTFKLMIHIVADYSLYWVLMNIRFHGRFQSPLLPGDPSAGIQVTGSGPLAGIVRVLLEALSIPLSIPAPSPISCLPNPHPPDFQRYAQIGILILLLWLLALFEPYGLRLRHVIMSRYQPERARARAEWLYNHIIRTRGSFLKYARRKLHREYKYSSEERYTFRRWLNNFIPCRCIRFLLRIGPEEPHCLLCGTRHIQNDSDTHLKRCDTPSCPGTFCARCFVDIGQLCTICLSPEDYGDLSDVSLEKGSSDDSDSEDSDYGDVGEHNPLIREPGFKGENDDKFVHTSPTIYRYKRLPKAKNNNSQEATSKFESTKQYNCTNHIQEHTNLDVDNSPKIKNEKFNSNPIIPVVVRDKGKMLKNVLVPKDKLKSVINTMKLLTTKVADGTFNNSWNTHKSRTFEYITMNLIEPDDVFKKALIVRQSKLNDNDSGHVLNNDGEKESLKQLVHFLCTYSMNDIMNNRIKGPDPVTNDLPTDLNVEKGTGILAPDTEKEKNTGKDLKTSKRDTNILKRYRMVNTAYLTEKLVRRRRIQLIRTAQRHCKPHYRNMGLICSRAYKIDESTFSRILSKKINKIFIAFKLTGYSVKCFEEKKTLTEDIKCNVRSRSQALSNNVSSNIKASDLKYSAVNENPNDIKAERKENNTFKTIYKVIRNQNVKSSHYVRLWMQAKTAFETNILTTLLKKPDSFLPKKLANHKRRKKRKIFEQNLNTKTPKAIHTTQDNDDARNFRLSLYFKDQEWRKNQNEQGVFKKNKPKKKSLNESISNFLLKLKKKTKKKDPMESDKKMKVAQEKLVRELKQKAKAEKKIKRKMKREAIKHSIINNMPVEQTHKGNFDNKASNEKKSVANEVKTTTSKTIGKEKLLIPIVEESFKTKHPHAPPEFCVSNCFNLFGLSKPVDLPEESIDFEEIFGEYVKDTDNIKERNSTELVYHEQKSQKRKLPQRPMVWPRDRALPVKNPLKKEVTPNNKCANKTCLEDGPVPNTTTKEHKEVYKTVKMTPKKTPQAKKCEIPDKTSSSVLKSFKGIFWTPDINRECDEQFQEGDTNVGVGGKKNKKPMVEPSVDKPGDGMVNSPISTPVGKKTSNTHTDIKKPPMNVDREIRSEKSIKINETEMTTSYKPDRNEFKEKREECKLVLEDKFQQYDKKEDDCYICKVCKASSIKEHTTSRTTSPLRLASDEFCSLKCHGGKRKCQKFCKTMLLESESKNKGRKNKKNIVEKEAVARRNREPTMNKTSKTTQAQLVLLSHCEAQCDPENCICCRDVGTEPSPGRTCTCAVQYSTLFDKNERQGIKLDAGTTHHCALTQTIDRETKSKRNYKPKGDPVTPPTTSESSSKSSVITIEYIKAGPRRTKRIVTKTNQSTLTERSESVDASTVTDWWSPMVERKPTQKRVKEKVGVAVATDGRYVSFNSYAQIIPQCDSYILSPSRYLLESQRYYDEMFSTGLLPKPFNRTITNVPFQKKDKGSDILLEKNSVKNVRKTLKTKRLEESYSQKKTQPSHLKLRTLTWRPVEPKESASNVPRRKSSRNSTVQIARKSKKKRDTQDKGVSAFKSNDRLHRSKSFHYHYHDTEALIHCEYDSTGSN